MRSAPERLRHLRHGRVRLLCNKRAHLLQVGVVDERRDPTGMRIRLEAVRCSQARAIVLHSVRGNTEAPGEKPYSYTFEAEVTDVNRQSVAGRAEVMVHPASYYVGLRSPAFS